MAALPKAAIGLPRAGRPAGASGVIGRGRPGITAGGMACGTAACLGWACAEHRSLRVESARHRHGDGRGAEAGAEADGLLTGYGGSGSTEMDREFTFFLVFP